MLAASDEGEGGGTDLNLGHLFCGKEAEGPKATFPGNSSSSPSIHSRGNFKIFISDSSLLPRSIFFRSRSSLQRETSKLAFPPVSYAAERPGEKGRKEGLLQGEGPSSILALNSQTQTGSKRLEFLPPAKDKAANCFLILRLLTSRSRKSGLSGIFLKLSELEGHTYFFHSLQHLIRLNE